MVWKTVGVVAREALFCGCNFAPPSLFSSEGGGRTRGLEGASRHMSGTTKNLQLITSGVPHPTSSGSWSSAHFFRKRNELTCHHQPLLSHYSSCSDHHETLLGSLFAYELVLSGLSPGHSPPVHRHRHGRPYWQAHGSFLSPSRDGRTGPEW